MTKVLLAYREREARRISHMRDSSEVLRTNSGRKKNSLEFALVKN
jgi:hypothetical protein